MSLESARAILESAIVLLDGERAADIMRRVLVELETPEEARRRKEREKKARQRESEKALKVASGPPPKPPDCPPDVPSGVPSMSPVVPECPGTNGTGTSLSSSEIQGSPSPSGSPSSLSLITAETPSKTESSRAREPRAKGVKTAMPDPDDAEAFDAFVVRWSLPLSRDLSRNVPVAAKFMAYCLKNASRYVRWDWAWRDWQAREGTFPGSSPTPVEAPRERPAPPPPAEPPASKAQIRAAVNEAMRPPVGPLFGRNDGR